MAEFMLAKVTRKGQMTIPQELRKALGIEPGDYVALRPLEGGVFLSKASVSPHVKAEDAFPHMLGPSEAIRSGDMIMRDAEGICCSIVYGQDARSPISPGTSHVLYVAYAPAGVPAEAVESQLRGIEENIRLFSVNVTVEQRRLLTLYLARLSRRSPLHALLPGTPPSIRKSQISNFKSQIHGRELRAPAARMGGLFAELGDQRPASSERSIAAALRCGENCGGI